MFEYYDVPTTFQKRYDAVIDEYIALVAKHLKDIGTLRPTEINRLEQIVRMGKNVNEINRKLRQATGLNQKELATLYASVANQGYTSFNKFYVARGIKQKTLAESLQLAQTIDAITIQTAGMFENLSNTTVIEEMYRKCIDKSVLAVRGGVTDYNSAIRSVIRETATNGNKVEYESGRKRDRESAIRMNVLDGIRQINREVALTVGEEFDADGIEISAHYNCALDHLEYQGKQYSIEQYNKINASLKRPFTYWNCRHFPMPIILGVSKPAYSDEKLADMYKQSIEDVKIGKRSKTRYEWTQEQRRLETRYRQLQRVKSMATQTGDQALKHQAMQEMAHTKVMYDLICKQANLQPKYELFQTILK